MSRPSPSRSRRPACKPKIFLLADHGFNTYSTLIETRREMVEKQPDLVQRFVDASAIGWYNYLYGDNKAANALIRKHNPEMSQELIDYSIAKMKEYGIVDSGDTLKLGIGAMTDARMASFFDKMVQGRRGQAERRFPQVLHAAVRQQGRRAGAAAEDSSAAARTSPPRPAPPSRRPSRSGCGAGRTPARAAMAASAVAFRSSASGSNANQRSQPGAHFGRPGRTAHAARTRP